MNVPGNEHYMNKVSLYLRDSAKYKVFPPDSIIYPKNGGAVFTNKKRILTVNSLIDLNTGAYIPSNLVDNKYAYYLFSTIDFNKFYKGTSVPTVDHDSICELFFGLPPLVEQKEIVKQLSEVFKNIDIVEEDKSILLETVSKAKSKILDLAIHGKLVPQDPNDEPASVLLEKLRAEKEEKIAKSELKRDKNDSYIYKGSDNCYYEKFKNSTIEEIDIPFEIPDTWCWCRLRDIVYDLGDGIHGTPKYDDKGQYYFINGNNLLNGKIEIKQSTKRVSETEYKKYKKNLSERTIFVSINGTLGNISFYNNEQIILGKSACYFNLTEHISKYYVYNFLNTNYFKKYVVENATGSTIKNVSLQAMRNLLIPIPPEEEQDRIVNTIKAVCFELSQIQNNII